VYHLIALFASVFTSS